MERRSRGGAVSEYIRSNVVGFVALFVALSGGAYAHGKIGTQDLRTGAVTAKKIRAGAVTPQKLRSNAVRTRHILEGSITTPLIADGAVSADKLAPGVAISGPQGPQGEQGPPGPATGPAGGDLTGSYPDPVIAAGAVTTEKLGTIPAAGAQVSLEPHDIPNGATIPLPLDVEVFDTAAMFDPVTSGFTIPIAGTYLIAGSVQLSGADGGNLQAQVLRNGGVLAHVTANATPQGFPLPLVRTARLDPGDVLTAVVFQQTGENLGISGASHLGVTWLGP